jgi:hypothetical protein
MAWADLSRRALQRLRLRAESDCEKHPEAPWAECADQSDFPWLPHSTKSIQIGDPNENERSSAQTEMDVVAFELNLNDAFCCHPE